MVKGVSPLRLFSRGSPKKPAQDLSADAVQAKGGGSGTGRAPLISIPESAFNPVAGDGFGGGLSPRKVDPGTPKKKVAGSGLGGGSFPHSENCEAAVTPDKHVLSSSAAPVAQVSKSRFTWHQRHNSAPAVDCAVTGGAGSLKRSPSVPNVEVATPSRGLPRQVNGAEGQPVMASQNAAAAGTNPLTPQKRLSSIRQNGDAENGTVLGSVAPLPTPARSVSRALKYGGATGVQVSSRSQVSQIVASRPPSSAQPAKSSLATPSSSMVTDLQFDLEEDPMFWRDHNVQVLIRTRPLSSSEISAQGYARCLKQESAHTITWLGQPEARFTFDHVACESISQEKLFHVAGLPMVDNCISGYNSCMFAYGQTGSGKTHTMLGDIDGLDNNRPSSNRGMTPRVFEYLFARIRNEEEVRRHERLKYLCKCSFLEIYNEQITDLLEPASSNLQMREDAKKGVYVENLTEVEVLGVQDVIQLLLQGAANRKVAATNMNRESSRSHSVFTCVVESKWESDSMVNTRFGRLNLVDLAGSERQKSSGAEGERLKEAANINKSLSTLGLVIMVLVDVANGKQRHVPYRDSKLTFLLQDSLGGNSKTTIIANVSPSGCCALETLSTLKFAQRAKFIRNNAVVNEDASGDVLALRQQIQQLKDELNRLRRQSVSRTPSIRSSLPLRESAQGYDDASMAIIGANASDPLRRSVDSSWDSAKFRHMSSKKMRHVEAVLAGSLRREQEAENASKRLAAEIEQLHRLVRQREEDTQCGKMMLRFREDKIRRLELVADGILPAHDYLMEEKHALQEELQLVRARIDRNPELTRFAMENIRLMEDLRRYQEFYEGGEREILVEEVASLRDQLLEVLDGKLLDECAGTLTISQREALAPELASAARENELLHLEVENYRRQIDEYRNNLNSCLESNAKMTRQIDDMEVKITGFQADQDRELEAMNARVSNQERVEELEEQLVKSRDVVARLEEQLKKEQERVQQETALREQETELRLQVELHLKDALEEAEGLRKHVQETAFSARASVKRMRMETDERIEKVQEEESPPSDEGWGEKDEVQLELQELKTQLQEARSLIEKLSVSATAGGDVDGDDRSGDASCSGRMQKVHSLEMRHSEEVMQLQLEIESYEAVLEEEQTQRKGLEERCAELSQQVGVLTEKLNEEKAVVEAMEGQQVFTVRELEELVVSLQKSEEEKKLLEQQVHHLRFELRKTKELKKLEAEFHTRSVEEQRSGAYDGTWKSALEGRLDETRRELEQAERLNERLQAQHAAQLARERDMDTTRAQAETETARTITALQSELLDMQEGAAAASAAERIRQLTAELDDVKLRLKEQEQQNETLRREWEMATAKLAEYLAEGDQALFDASLEMDEIIEETFSQRMTVDVRSSFKVADKGRPLDIMQKKLQSAHCLARDTEAELRAFSKSVSEFHESHEQEKAELKEQIIVLSDAADIMSRKATELQAEMLQLELKCSEAERKAYAALLCVRNKQDNFCELHDRAALLEFEVEDLKAALSQQGDETNVIAAELVQENENRSKAARLESEVEDLKAALSQQGDEMKVVAAAWEQAKEKGSKADLLEAELETARRKLVEKDSSIAHAETTWARRLDDVQLQLEEIRNDGTRKASKVGELQGRIQELDLEVASLTLSLNQSVDQYSSAALQWRLDQEQLSADLAKAKADSAKGAAEVCRLAERLAIVEAERQQLTSSLQAAEDGIRCKESLWEQQKETLAVERQRLRQAAETSQEHIAELGSTISSLELQLERLEASRVEVERSHHQERESWNAEKHSLTRSLEGSKAAKDSLEAELTRVSGLLLESRQRLSVAQDRRKNGREHSGVSEAKSLGTDEGTERLKCRIASLESELENVQLALEGKDESNHDLERKWRREKDQLLLDLNEARLEAREKGSESASLLKRFQEGQSTLMELERIMNALIRANEKSKSENLRLSLNQEEYEAELRQAEDKVNAAFTSGRKPRDFCEFAAGYGNDGSHGVGTAQAEAVERDASKLREVAAEGSWTHKLEVLLGELSEARTDASEKTSKAEALQGHVGELKTELEAAKREISQKCELLAHQVDTETGLRKRVSELQLELEEAMALAEQRTCEVQELEGKVRQLGDELLLLSGQLHEAEVKMKVDAEAHEANASKLEVERQRVRMEVREMHAAEGDLRREVEQLRLVQEETQSAASQKTLEAQQLELKVSLLEVEFTQLSEVLEGSKLKKEADTSVWNKERHQLVENVSGLEAQLEAATQELLVTRTVASRRSSEAEELEGRVRLLEREVAELSEVLQEAKTTSVSQAEVWSSERSQFQQHVSRLEAELVTTKQDLTDSQSGWSLRAEEANSVADKGRAEVEELTGKVRALQYEISELAESLEGAEAKMKRDAELWNTERGLLQANASKLEAALDSAMKEVLDNNAVEAELREKVMQLRMELDETQAAAGKTTSDSAEKVSQLEQELAQLSGLMAGVLAKTEAQTSDWNAERNQFQEHASRLKAELETAKQELCAEKALLSAAQRLRIEELCQQLEETQSLGDKKTIEALGLEAKVRQLEQELSQVSQSLEIAQARLDNASEAWSSERSQLVAEVKRLEEVILVAKEDAKTTLVSREQEGQETLAKAHSQFQQEKENLLLQLAEARFKTEEQQVEAGALRKRLEDGQSALREMESTLKALVSANESLKSHTEAWQSEKKRLSLSQEEHAALQSKLQRTEELKRGLEFDISLLQESTVELKEQKDAAQRAEAAVLQLEQELDTRGQELREMEARVCRLEGALQDKERLLAAMSKEMAQAKRTISSCINEADQIKVQLQELRSETANLETGLAAKSRSVDSLRKELEQANELSEAAAAEALALKEEVDGLRRQKDVLEDELEDKQQSIAALEMELLDVTSMEQDTARSLKKELNHVTKERDRLHAELLVLTEQLEMAHAIAEEQESLASEARQMAEASKTRAEERDAEARLLERSVEELESTVNALESQVGIVKREGERQRILREDLEMELQSLKHHMNIVQASTEDRNAQRVQDLREARAMTDELERTLEEKEMLLLQSRNEADQLRKEVEEKSGQIQHFESLLEHSKPISLQQSSSKSSERAMIKTKSGGSPFKCGGKGLVQQMHSDIDEELYANRNRIEELEGIAAARQKEVFMLHTRLAEAESMTHDVVRDLLGVKLDITNFASVLSQEKIQQIAESARKRSDEAREKETELESVRAQLNDFIEERESWLEEINRRQAEMVAARVAAEKLRLRDQTLAAENERLQAENGAQRKRLTELEGEVRKLSGQQNLQQRIHHHAKIKEENNQLRVHNDDLTGRLRRTEAVLGRVSEELARYRTAEGKKPFLNIDEEQRLKNQLKEEEDNRIQMAQTLIGLCTSIMQAAGVGSPSTEVDSTIAIKALRQLEDRLHTAERELSDIRLTTRIAGEKRRLSELRAVHSPYKTNFTAGIQLSSPREDR